MHTKIEKWMEGFVWAALFSLAAFTFTSNSLSALSHIFILPPIFYLLYKRELFKNFSWSQGFLWAFIGWATLATIFSPYLTNKFAHIIKLKHLFIPLLAIAAYQWGIKKSVNSPRLIKWAMNLFCVSLILANISGLIALFTQFHPIKWKAAADLNRAAGLYGMAITYGYGIQFIALVFAASFVVKRSFLSMCNKYLFWGAGISSLLGLYFSYTRGALIGFLAGLLIVCFFKSKKVFLWGLLLTVLLLSSLLTYIAFNSKQGNLLLQPLTSDSNMMRVGTFKAALKAAGENPVWGLGWRAFQSQSVRIKTENNYPFSDFEGHAHNNFLEVLADTGVIGFILFVAFVLNWLREAWLLVDARKYLIVPPVIAFIVSGLFQCTLIDAENVFLFMFLYVLTQIDIKALHQKT